MKSLDTLTQGTEPRQARYALGLPLYGAFRLFGRPLPTFPARSLPAVRLPTFPGCAFNNWEFREHQRVNGWPAIGAATGPARGWAPEGIPNAGLVGAGGAA